MVSGGFRGQPKWFRRSKSWFLRNSPAGPGEHAPVEKSGRPVNSCAASACEHERILVVEAVDMLRISAGNRPRRSESPCYRPILADRPSQLRFLERNQMPGLIFAHLFKELDSEPGVMCLSGWGHRSIGDKSVQGLPFVLVI